MYGDVPEHVGQLTLSLYPSFLEQKYSGLHVENSGYSFRIVLNKCILF